MYVQRGREENVLSGSVLQAKNATGLTGFRAEADTNEMYLFAKEDLSDSHRASFGFH